MEPPVGGKLDDSGGFFELTTPTDPDFLMTFIQCRRPGFTTVLCDPCIADVLILGLDGEPLSGRACIQATSTTEAIHPLSTSSAGS